LTNKASVAATEFATVIGGGVMVQNNQTGEISTIVRGSDAFGEDVRQKLGLKPLDEVADGIARYKAERRNNAK